MGGGALGAPFLPWVRRDCRGRRAATHLVAGLRGADRSATAAPVQVWNAPLSPTPSLSFRAGIGLCAMLLFAAF